MSEETNHGRMRWSVTRGAPRSVLVNLARLEMTGDATGALVQGLTSERFLYDELQRFILTNNNSAVEVTDPSRRLLKVGFICFAAAACLVCNSMCIFMCFKPL